MGKISSEILTSVKLMHLTPSGRWVWVVLNLLEADREQRVCNSQGKVYSIPELAAFSMMDEQGFRVCISELISMAMVELEGNSVRLLWDYDEEKRHRRKINARNRKARQRSRGKERSDPNGSQKEI